MTKFNAGDWVRANDSVLGQFTKDKIYRVKGHCGWNNNILIEVDDSGRTDNGWGKEFFDLVRRADEPWQVGDVVSWGDVQVWQNATITRIRSTTWGGLGIWVKTETGNGGLFDASMIDDLKLIEPANDVKATLEKIISNTGNLAIEVDEFGQSSIKIFAKQPSHEPTYKEIKKIAENTCTTESTVYDVYQAIIANGFTIQKEEN